MTLQSPSPKDWNGFDRFCDEQKNPKLRRYACLGLNGMIGIRSLTEEEAEAQNYLFCQSGDQFRYVPFEDVESAWRTHQRSLERQRNRELNMSGLFALGVMAISTLLVFGSLAYVVYVIAEAFGVRF